ncbi:MAG: oxidoreductase [Mycobacterium sp.]|nr:oxidoreductase [Mycobacterium sp.]
MVALVVRRIFSLPVFTLNGWVAFNLPRTVTALGGSLLLGLAAVHGYLVETAPGLPVYFAVYSAVLAAGCLAAAGALISGFKAGVPRFGWYFGSSVCLAFLIAYLVSRWVTLPRLQALTGRWDFAPGTLAMACAAGFIAVHTTVLSGVNVAYPQRRDWRD